MPKFNTFKSVINTKSVNSKTINKIAKIKNISNFSNVISSIENANFSQNSNISEAVPAKSIISKTVFSYDIPEIEKLDLEFIYNFFEKDEREIEALERSERIINLETDSTSDVLFATKNEKLPRYVRVFFKGPNDPFAKISKFNNKTLLNNINKIAREGAGSDKFFTGFELIDSGEEKTIYNNLRFTSFATNVQDPNNSMLESAKKVSDIINDKEGLTGLGKKIILESLNQLKGGEIQYAESDVRPEVAAFSDNPVGRQSFSVKCNNLFISNIIKKANAYPTGVFQDELVALEDTAEDFQKNTLSKIGDDPTQLNEDQFTNQSEAFEILSGNPFRSKGLRKSSQKGFNDPEAIKEYEVLLVGYMIEKVEILPDESVITNEPFIITDPQNLFFVDKNVRYGGNYIYTIRTICQVTSPVVKIDPDNPLLDEVVFARFLMASEGVTKSVLCTEKEPPPPPVNLKARFDFRQKAPILTWSFPVNPQRDIKRFQIFKRNSTSEPFVLIGEYDFDDSVSRTTVIEVAQPKNLFRFKRPKTSFIDKKFIVGSRPIYAIASVDAHGMTSNYSNQISVFYDKLKNRIQTQLISRQNAPKPYPNIYLEEDTFKDNIKVSNYDRMHVFFDPEYYRVFKNDSVNEKNKATREKDLGLIAVDPDKATYSIQILNIDNQKEETVNITIEDRSEIPRRFTANTIGNKFVSNKK